MTCTCDQCDSPFCVLQLTALIKPNWCVLLYRYASLRHSLIVVQPSWTAVPGLTTKLGLLISKPFVRIKQSVICVASKTPVKTRLGICIYKTSLSHRPDGYIGFTSSCPPHILQQNCAHAPLRTLFWSLYSWKIKLLPEWKARRFEAGELQRIHCSKRTFLEESICCTGGVFRLCKPAVHVASPEILTSQIIRQTHFLLRSIRCVRTSLDRKKQHLGVKCCTDCFAYLHYI